MNDGAAPVVSVTEPTVLVVDDDRDWCCLVELALGYEGFRVVHAYSGEDALRTFHAGVPDAVVLDIVLPGMDGWEVLRGLARDGDVPPIPVVVVSGEVESDAGARVTELGGWAYLPKSCSVRVLVRTVRSAVGR